MKEKIASYLHLDNISNTQCVVFGIGLFIYACVVFVIGTMLRTYLGEGLELNRIISFIIMVFFWGTCFFLPSNIARWIKNFRS